MAIPKYWQFISPLLRHLASHPEGARVADTMDALADEVALTDEERAELLPSGKQQRFKNRIGWAHDSLNRAGLSTSPERGVWRITPAGLELVANFPDGLPESECRRIASINRRKAISEIGGQAEPSAAERAISDLFFPGSPDERIEEAVEELNDAVATELLGLIGRSSPRFFETLVLDLLHAMGYGTSREDLQRVGGSGDGGIDGVISLDLLGLEKIYVQAKRWQGAVGSPQIQTFVGALQLQGADKGVLITTSTFTKDARQAASRSKGSIVLVDGTRLSALMIQHGVGVSHKLLKVPKVDSDYFEEL